MELGKFIFKFHSHFLPVNFESYFKLINQHNKTRYKFNLNYYLAGVNKNYGKKIIAYRGTKLWSEEISIKIKSSN